MSSSLHSAPALPPDDSHGYQYIAVQWSLVSIAVILVSFRFCVRGLLRRKVGADDYTILAALICALVQSCIAIVQVRGGFGRHIFYLNSAQIETLFRDGYVTILFNLAGVFLARISVCLFILQLLPFTQRVSRWCIYGLMVFFTIIAVATFLFMCLQCIPIQGIWDETIDAHCVGPAVITKVNQVQGAFSVIMDILCVFLPITVFGSLQHINWREKLAVIFLLALGLCTAGAAVARILLYYFEGDDPTWGLIPEAIWASVEQNVGIIVACMPALRQFFTGFRKQRSAQRSNISEKPFADANHFTASPLSAPPAEYRQQQSDLATTDLDSPVSHFAEKRPAQQQDTDDEESRSSPTFSIGSLLAPLSPSSAETSHQGFKAHHRKGLTPECKKKWEERRGSRPTLGNPAVLGYSCTIEGRSPKSPTRRSRLSLV